MQPQGHYESMLQWRSAGTLLAGQDQTPATKSPHETAANGNDHVKASSSAFDAWCGMRVARPRLSVCLRAIIQFSRIGKQASSHVLCKQHPACRFCKGPASRLSPAAVLSIGRGLSTSRLGTWNHFKGACERGLTRAASLKALKAISRRCACLAEASA